MPRRPPRSVNVVLTIAGSDPSGGAGIQADLKTFAALGVYGESVLVALTAQNTVGVTGVHEVPVDFVLAQLRTVFDDIPPDVVKTGMLATRDLVEAVGGFLRRRHRGPVVVDPVMVATSGARLLAEDAIDAVRRHLLPLATLATPNAPEAGILAGVEVRDPATAAAAGRRIRRFGARAVLVKGGHVPGDEVIDVLVTEGGVREIRRPRIESRSTHGTGCTLSAAVAAHLAASCPLEVAVDQAVRYVRAAIVTAPGLGRGAGPLNHSDATSLSGRIKARSEAVPPQRVAILGAGEVGRSLGVALREAGWPVTAVCRRNAGRARAAARAIGPDVRWTTDLAEAAIGADTLIFAMRDGEIGGAAAALAASAGRAGLRPGQVAIHCSGIEPSAILAPLRAHGLLVASLHPLQTFHRGVFDMDRHTRVGGVWFFHEGDAMDACAAIVDAVGGTMAEIAAERKTLYHAAAVVASNYLVALESAAARIAIAAGIPHEDVQHALSPLIDTTTRNLLNDFPWCLTGPIARGDAATVARHREALAAVDPELDALYTALGHEALRVATAMDLAPTKARRVAAALRRKG